MNRLRDIRMTALMALMACGLYFSGFLVMLTPLPLMYVIAVRGRRPGFAAAALAGCVVIAVYVLLLLPGGAVQGGLAYLPAPGLGLASFMPAGFPAVFGIGYFGFFVAVAVVLALFPGGRRTLAASGGAALAAGAAAAVLTFLAAKFFCQGSLLEGLRAFVSYVLSEFLSANEAAGVHSAQIAYLADNAEAVAASIMGVLPALAFAYAAFSVAINAVLGRRFLKAGSSAAGFKLPDGLIWTVIACGSLFFANSYLLGLAPLSYAALNGLIALGVLYFLQGMAVTSYFLQRIRFSLLRTVVYIAMIIFLQTVSVALIVLGIADVWADFRLRHLRMLQEQR